MGREKLKALCLELVNDPSLKGRLIKCQQVTYCNIAVKRMAEAFGCQDFAATPMANEICSMLIRSWKQLDAKQAHEEANKGNLVIASHKYPGHGHVAVVYPAERMGYSGKWEKDMPMVANVGKLCGIMGVNFAFTLEDGEPMYHVWNAK